MESGCESDGRNASGFLRFCNFSGGSDFCVKETQFYGGGATEGGGGEVLFSSRPGTDASKQLFDDFSYQSSAMAEFPFTFAQWKELQIQAMIYKYMASSVPVPPELLYPLSRRSATMAAAAAAVCSSSSSSSPCLLRMRNRDLEPGRCKRTDGKKWRCSRDVAPHQKYCERHLHRGRPRSRKHVEIKPPIAIPEENEGEEEEEEESHKKLRIHQPPQQFLNREQPPWQFPAPEMEIVPAAVDFPMEVRREGGDSSAGGGRRWEGGPLAEALQLSGWGSPLNESVGTASPSGVLPRSGLFSNSGGSSVCNSPTFGCAEAAAGFFRWN